MRGARVVQLSVSAGGVPKLPVAEAQLGQLGLAGDGHRSPLHGGPERALCLYAAERIEALREEGHAAVPGALGENVTIAGLDWSAVSPGDRMRIGEALVELTRYVTPCKNIQPVFQDGRFARVLQDEHPGWSRLYARVLVPGLIRTDDPVELLSHEAAVPPGGQHVPA